MKKSAATRLGILEKAFALIYVQGYQATSVDEIIARTQVTKGAFYYHFKSKDDMGIAIIDELLRPRFRTDFITPLEQDGHPFDMIYQLMYHILMENEFLKVEYGCPAANFTQEMAPWHADFTVALNALAKQWEEAMIKLLREGQAKGLIRLGIPAEEVAVFVMAGYWGIRNIGKLANSKSVYLIYLQQLKLYFDNMK